MIYYIIFFLYLYYNKGIYIYERFIEFINMLSNGNREIQKTIENQQAHSNLYIHDKSENLYNTPINNALISTKTETDTGTYNGNQTVVSSSSINDTTSKIDKLKILSEKLEVYLSNIFSHLNFNNSLYKLFNQINFHIYQDNLTRHELILLIYKEQDYFKNYINENTYMYNEFISRINALENNYENYKNKQNEFNEYNLMHRWLNEGNKVSDRSYTQKEKNDIVQTILYEVTGKKVNVQKIQLNDYNMQQIKLKILDLELKKEKIKNKITLTKMLIIE